MQNVLFYCKAVILFYCSNDMLFANDVQWAVTGGAPRNMIVVCHSNI